MPYLPALDEALAAVGYIGSLCQVGTALIAAGIGVMTFRYTKGRARWH